jgi:hypothetical protein
MDGRGRDSRDKILGTKLEKNIDKFFVNMTERDPFLVGWGSYLVNAVAGCSENITKGTDFDMQHPQMGPLLQVMPWPAYSNMNPRQIRAIPRVTVPGLP